MVKPNTYHLGSTPEIILAFEDVEDEEFLPVNVRLSIQAPDGSITTVSGGDLTTTSVSGAYTYIYRPTMAGWYEYEGWGKDGTGREIVKSHGFEVSDILRNT